MAMEGWWGNLWRDRDKGWGFRFRDEVKLGKYIDTPFVRSAFGG